MTKDTSPVDPAANDDPRFGAAGHRPEALQTLRQAMRRVRYDDAERVGVLAELRATQLGRLEVLQDALHPLLAQIPPDAVDVFDMGLMPGATPRLFVDMIGFVEMGRDARLYRFLQDTRYRRLTLAESNDIQTMVTAVTDYVARRLLERDKALATDTAEPRGQVGAVHAVQTPHRGPLRRVVGWLGAIFEFVIFLLGTLAFFGLLAATGYYAWIRLQGQI